MTLTVKMVHPVTGIIKEGYIGFSYTYFFLGIFSLGWIVPLYRGHLGITVLCVIFHMFTLPLWMLTALLFGIFFNKYYTLQLIEEGYVFDDEDVELVNRAKSLLGIK